MPYPDRLTGWRDTPPPPQATRVYYAYRILARGGFGSSDKGNYATIGTFQTFNPTSTRTVTRVRGICNNSGYPLELVPGPADTTINVTYLMLYLLPLNEALGYKIGSVVDLNRQRVPFDIMEQCVFPDADDATVSARFSGIPPGLKGSFVETNYYYECYLASLGRTITQGTVTITETAIIQITGVAPGNNAIPGYGVIRPTDNYASLGALAGTGPANAPATP
jgi:hypothetical protein